MPDTYDVVVVGGGNAALSAALTAKEICGSVLVVEKAPEYFRGGNTYFTGGIIRFAFDGLEDIKTLIPDMSATEEASVDVGSYPQDQFYADMMRVTQGLSDPELAQILVSQSLPTMQWLREKGVRFILSYGRQAFKDGDKFRFWGGLLVEAAEGEEEALRVLRNTWRPFASDAYKALDRQRADAGRLRRQASVGVQELLDRFQVSLK